MMKRPLLYAALVPVLGLLVLGCAKKDRLFDTTEELNPRVRHANYEDKISAFKLYIPPGVWRIVAAKNVDLALLSRTCVGKVSMDAGWLFGPDLEDTARKTAEEMFDGSCQWLDKQQFTVDDCPAVIVAAKGRILYASAEKFYVDRVVAVGVIKFGSRKCVFKYIAPQECYSQTKDDLLDLMRGFERIERGFGKHKGEEDKDEENSSPEAGD